MARGLSKPPKCDSACNDTPLSGGGAALQAILLAARLPATAEVERRLGALPGPDLWRGDVVRFLIGSWKAPECLWIEGLRRSLYPSDLRVRVAKFHDHFRRLARQLLNVGRVEEALVTFESGRGIAHTFMVDRSSFEKLVSANPFEPTPSFVSRSSLVEAQSQLAATDALLGVCLIPPEIVAFVIHADDVKVAAVSLPATDIEQANFLGSIRMIPARLAAHVGARTIPQEFHDLARRVRPLIGNRVLLGIAPHGFLHQIPWRALLRDKRIPWTQLQASIEFGLLLGRPSFSSIDQGAAAGYGTAVSGNEIVDLCDEARAFARHFANRSLFRDQCTSTELRGLLGRPGAILISCHGGIPSESVRLRLELADGEVRLG